MTISDPRHYDRRVGLDKAGLAPSEEASSPYQASAYAVDRPSMILRSMKSTTLEMP